MTTTFRSNEPFRMLMPVRDMRGRLPEGTLRFG